MPFVDPVELFRQTAEKMFDLDPQELELLLQQQPMQPMQPGMEPGMEAGMMTPEEEAMSPTSATQVTPPEGLGIEDINGFQNV
jgi:hypothetical protein